MSCNWQRWAPLITTWLSTWTSCEGHASCACSAVLVVSVQLPGPCSGRSAASNVGVSTPLSTPLVTLTLGALSGDLTFEPVAFEDFGAVTTALVVAVARAVGVAVTGGVRVEGRDLEIAIVVATVVVATVVVGIVGATVEDGEGPWANNGWVAGFDVVRVKTSTSSNNGLDHITRCAPLSDESRCAMDLKTYRGWG